MKVLYVVGENYHLGTGIFSIIEPLIRVLNEKEIIANVLMIENTRTELCGDNVFLLNSNFSYENFNEYSLVIFNGIYYLTFMKIAAFLRKSNIPYCFKPHSSLMKASLRKYFIRKIVYLLIFRNILKNASGIIYTNKEELENSFRFLNKRNIIEMNGIDNPNAFKKKNNKSDVVNLFFLARLDFSHKGVDILLKALSKLKDFFEKENCYFSIYGNGSEKELKKFNKYMNKIDSERIVYKGCIFGDEKNHMYNNQDICVLPSRYEGFPTSITEALFFGIPCVLTKGTNGKDICINGAGWFAPETNEKCLANTIKNAVCEYKQNSENFRNKAFNYAVKYGNISTVVLDAMNNIYLLSE